MHITGSTPSASDLRQQNAQTTPTSIATDGVAFSPEWSDFALTFPKPFSVKPVHIDPLSGLRAKLIDLKAQCVLRAYALKSPGNDLTRLNDSVVMTFLRREIKTNGLIVDEIGVKPSPHGFMGYARTHKIVDQEGQPTVITWYIEQNAYPSDSGSVIFFRET